MKSFLAAAVLLATTALGVGHSAAQTGTSSPGSVGATSPLGADFGQTSGNSQARRRPACRARAASEQRHRSGRISARPLVIIPKSLLRRLPIPRLAERRFWRGRAIHLRRRGLSPTSAAEPDNQFHDLRRRRRKQHVDAVQFGEQFRRHECPEFCGHDHIGRKFFLIAFIRVVRKPWHGAARRIQGPWRNRPRHERSRYDGTRDDRPRLTADPVRIDIANSNVAINSDAIRDNVFRRPRYAADEHRVRRKV